MKLQQHLVVHSLFITQFTTEKVPFSHHKAEIKVTYLTLPINGTNSFYTPKLKSFGWLPLHVPGLLKSPWERPPLYSHVA